MDKKGVWTIKELLNSDISQLEQEAERRGAINALKKVLENGKGDGYWRRLPIAVLEELKLLEEENGEQ